MSEPATSTPAEPTQTPTEGAEPAAQPSVTDWEAEARKWEKRSKDNFAKLKEAEPKLAEYDKLRQSQQTEVERQAEELTRWQTEAQQWRGMAINSRVETLATDFADPTDALAALGDTSKYLDAGGQINEDAIRTDLTALLEKKPHWRRPDGAQPLPRVPAPNPHQGSGGGTPASDPKSEFGAIIRQANSA
jgi:molecular chaperone GrpE (heat shock protein)